MQNKNLLIIFVILLFLSVPVIAADNLSEIKRIYSVDPNNGLDLTVGAVGLMCSYATFKALPEVNDVDNKLIKTTKYVAKGVLPVAAFGIPKLLIGYVVEGLLNELIFASIRR